MMIVQYAGYTHQYGIDDGGDSFHICWDCWLEIYPKEKILGISKDNTIKGKSTRVMGKNAVPNPNLKFCEKCGLFWAYVDGQLRYVHWSYLSDNKKEFCPKCIKGE